MFVFTSESLAFGFDFGVMASLLDSGKTIFRCVFDLEIVPALTHKAINFPKLPFACPNLFSQQSRVQIQSRNKKMFL